MSDKLIKMQLHHVPASVRKGIKIAALQDGITMQALIVNILREWLDWRAREKGEI